MRTFQDLMTSECGAERREGSGLVTVYHDGKFGVRIEEGGEEVKFCP